MKSNIFHWFYLFPYCIASAGLTIVANVAIATGPAFLGTSRSSAINLIYYIVYKILFNLRNQYFTKFSVSVSKDFQLKSVCVQKVFFDSFLYSYVTKDIRLRSAVLPF